MFVAAGLQLEIDPWMMQLACLAWVSFFAIQAARESAFMYYGTMILWEFLVLPTGANFDSSALVFRASAATHKVCCCRGSSSNATNHSTHAVARLLCCLPDPAMGGWLLRLDSVLLANRQHKLWARRLRPFRRPHVNLPIMLYACPCTPNLTRTSSARDWRVSLSEFGSCCASLATMQQT